MAEACPFTNFQEMIVFLANNALTGGDNQLLYDGRERSGKTTLARTVNRYLYQYLHREDILASDLWDQAKAQQTATLRAGRVPTLKELVPGAKRYLKPHEREWNFIDNCVFDFGDWEDIYGRQDDLGQHQCDEGGNLLFSRNSQTGENKQIIQTVQMCGIRHATFSWVLPNKHWMDPYIREHRATVWGHVHTSYTLAGMTRGLASFHWRQDNYMTGNVWWSDPIFWHEFQSMVQDGEQAAYDSIKAAKLYESTVAKGVRRKA